MRQCGGTGGRGECVAGLADGRPQRTGGGDGFAHSGVQGAVGPAGVDQGPDLREAFPQGFVRTVLGDDRGRLTTGPLADAEGDRGELAECFGECGPAARALLQGSGCRRRRDDDGVRAPVGQAARAQCVFEGVGLDVRDVDEAHQLLLRGLVCGPSAVVAAARAAEEFGDLAQDPGRDLRLLGQVEVPGVEDGVVGLDAQGRARHVAQALRGLRCTEFGGSGGARDRAAAAGEQVAGGGAEVGEGAVEEVGRGRSSLQLPAEVVAYVLRQRVVVGGPAAELAPLPEVHRFRDRPEAGVRGDGEQGDAVLAAGVRHFADTSAALRVPGVHAVLTHEDAPATLYSSARHEHPTEDPDDTRVLDDVVRYVGQRIAAVVADSEQAAEEGCRRVEVTYQELPHVTDPEAAMRPGAPRHVRIDERGEVTTAAFRRYRLPQYADVPRTEVHFSETSDAIGPLGAKSMSESPFNPVAPAFAI